MVLLAVNHDPRLREKVIGMVFAPAETEEGYRSLADQLLSRGMDPHAPLVVVSDGAQAIPAGFSRSFTNVAFQRCQWHLAQEVKELAPPQPKSRPATTPGGSCGLPPKPRRATACNASR